MKRKRERERIFYREEDILEVCEEVKILFETKHPLGCVLPVCFLRL
jgi:hypothetical protein